MFIAVCHITLSSSVRSDIRAWPDAAPDGARGMKTTPIYKHCAPNGAEERRFV